MYIDIDECEKNNGGCSQHCVNHVPGYECQCDFGWFMSEDMKTCFGKHLPFTLHAHFSIHTVRCVYCLFEQC